MFIIVYSHSPQACNSWKKTFEVIHTRQYFKHIIFVQVFNIGGLKFGHIRHVAYYNYHTFLLQVVQGGPLPPVPSHIPVSSFSSDAGLSQLPTAITTSVVYDEKVCFI